MIRPLAITLVAVVSASACAGSPQPTATSWRELPAPSPPAAQLLELASDADDGGCGWVAQAIVYHDWHAHHHGSEVIAILGLSITVAASVAAAAGTDAGQAVLDESLAEIAADEHNPVAQIEASADELAELAGRLDECRDYLGDERSDWLAELAGRADHYRASAADAWKTD